MGMDDVNDTDKRNTRDHGLSWNLTEKDVNHVILTIVMMLQANDIIMKEDLTLKNVYVVCVRTLSDAILDKKTFELGKHLIIKYLISQEMLMVVLRI